MPPQTPLFRGQGLSHTQAGPLRQPPTRSTERQNQGFLPPATPPSLRHAQGQRGTFKPAMAGPAQLSKANTPQAQRPGIRPKMTTAHDRRQMGPPPPLTTVQDQIQEHPRAGFTPAPGSRAFAPTPQTNRFMPSTANGSRFVPQAPSGAPQRFVPAGASDSRQASTSASNRRSGNPWN